jgi:hypothetical protein
MLEEEQLIGDTTLGALGDQPVLQREGLAVRHPAEPRGDDRPRLRGRPGPSVGQRLDRHEGTIAGRAAPARRAIRMVRALARGWAGGPAALRRDPAQDAW